MAEYGDRQLSVASGVPALDPQTRIKIEEIKERFHGTVVQKSKEWLYNGKWLRSGVVRYTGPDGGERVWETVERTTRKGNVDGVDILGESYTLQCQQPMLMGYPIYSCTYCR